MSPRSSRFRLVIGAALGLLFFLLAPSASAQQIQILLKDTLVRRDANGNQITKDPNLQPYGINLFDCIGNQTIEFSLTMSGYLAGDTVEVWATDSGGDCTQPTARTGGVATCYKLDVGVPLTPSPVVRIPVKDIIKGMSTTSDQIDQFGCRRSRAASSVTVFFMLFRGGTTIPATTQDSVAIKFKTLGPEALTGVKVLPGDTRVTVQWDQIGEGGVSDVVGVKAYCDTNPQAVPATPGTVVTVCKDASIDDSGDVSTADADCTTSTVGGSAGGPIPPPSPGFPSNGVACAASSFSPVDGGRIVPDTTFTKYQCGSLNGITGNSIIATDIGGAPLPDNTTIAVSVAGTDSFGNVGELSDPICQYPEPTQDFWQDYRAAGGKAGGCDIAGASSTAASSCLLAIAVAMSGSMLRRRAQRKKKVDR